MATFVTAELKRIQDRVVAIEERFGAIASEEEDLRGERTLLENELKELLGASTGVIEHAEAVLKTHK